MSNIVGRAELLCCVFFLLSILTYYWAINRGITIDSIIFVPRYGENTIGIHGIKYHTRWPLVMISILFSGLAMFSKEQGITSIGVYLLLDILLCWNIVWSKIHMWLRGKNSIMDDITFRHHMHRIGNDVIFNYTTY